MRKGGLVAVWNDTFPMVKTKDLKFRLVRPVSRTRTTTLAGLLRRGIAFKANKGTEPD